MTLKEAILKSLEDLKAPSSSEEILKLMRNEQLLLTFNSLHFSFLTSHC